MIDGIDRKILQIMQDDGRVSNAEVARRIGMAPSAVLERVRKLEERGVIRGYSARLCPKGLDRSLLAFIFVQSDEGVCETATGEVQEVHHVAGEDCFLVKVRVRDTDALTRLMRERLGASGKIRSTRTTIVLDTVKETNTLPLEDASKDGTDE
jgi:Lrp/AsnC family leucine-responsive transcriptional regulator